MKGKVAIILGSDSDWPTVEPACQTLDDLQIPYEVRVLSAHRSPDALRDYVIHAETSGLAVILAAAGGAAHLPGIIAAYTSLPVIGIPIETKSLGGLDSLLSMVQMPGGVPVATTAIGSGGARNAALFAARILALGDDALRQRLADYRQKLAEQVQEKDQRLQDRLAERRKPSEQ